MRCQFMFELKDAHRLNPKGTALINVCCLIEIWPKEPYSSAAIRVYGVVSGMCLCRRLVVC